MKRMLGRSAATRGPTIRKAIRSARFRIADCELRIEEKKVCAFMFLIHNPKSQIRNRRVPLEGVEPPLTCVNMDLNHARLPIPPQRRGRMIVPGTREWFKGSLGFLAGG